MSLKTLAIADPELVPAFKAARFICRKNAGDLYAASFFLPARKRNAIHVMYAFCRLIREAIIPPDAASASPVAADSCCGGSSLDNRIALIRDRLDEIYSGKLEMPNLEFRSEAQHILFAASKTIERYAIPMEYLTDLVDGCRMDQTVKRFATWGSLENYCHHTAGAMGMTMSCILGLRNSDAGQYVYSLCASMQLTDLLCNLPADWKRGRIYLPLEDLSRFGYSETQLSGASVNDAFRRLIRFEVARARQLYREGNKGIRWLADDGSRLMAATLATITCGALDAIEHCQFNLFGGHIRLTTAQKFRRLPTAWRLAKKDGIED